MNNPKPKSQAKSGAITPRKFPNDTLPEPVRSYVSESAAAICCNPVFIALPMISAIASTIGSAYRIQLKKDWNEPSVIWVAIVGVSGTLKTPAQKIALEPLERRELQAITEYKDARVQYESNKDNYERAYDSWRKVGKDRRGEPQPVKPQEPICTRYIVTDITCESLALKLQENPRGFLVARDELAGWFNSFTQYKRDTSDAPNWLSMWSAGSIRVDRKTGGEFTFVPIAAVSVCGGIQPGTLRRALTMVHRENGLAARLLLAYPPRQPRRWTEAEISLAVKHAVNKLFNGLLSLPAKRDESGNIEPIDLPLNDDAKSRFARFVNEHGAEQYNTTYGDLAAVWSKLEAYAARFALIFHFIRLVGNDPTLMYAEQVDAASIEAGIALAEWFGSEARRIYGILAESEDEQATGELVELIQRHGGEITAHDLSKTCRSRFPRAEDAEAALNALAKSDYGVLTNLVPGSKGGRPTSIFRLNSIHQNPKTPVIAEKIEVSGYCPKRIDRKDEIRKVKKE